MNERTRTLHRQDSRTQPPPLPAAASRSAEPVPPTRGRRALRHAGRGARFFLFATIPFIVLLVLGLALTYVRLKHGPISLAFLVPPIERSLNAVLEGYKASVEDAIVQLTDGNRLEFRLQNVRFREKDGDVVAASPLASMQISRKAMLQGKFVPSRVELIKPELFLSYSQQKGLGLSFSELPPVSELHPPAPRPVDAKTAREIAKAAQEGEPVAKNIDFATLLKRATSEARAPGGAASFLREFGVRDATLHVDHHGHRTTWQLPEVGIDFDHRESRSVISGRASVEAGAGVWNFSFYTEDADGKLTLRASMRDLVPASLFDRSKSSSPIALADFPIGADVTLTLEQDGSVRTADIDLGLGQGQFMLQDDAGRPEPIPVEAGRFKMTYEPKAGTITIAPSTLQAGGSTLKASGMVRAFDDGTESGWTYKLSSGEGTLGSGEFSVAPIPIEHLNAEGRYLPARERFEIAQAELKAGGTTFSSQAEISLSEKSPGLRLRANAGPMPAATMKAIWPTGLAPKSRRWFGENVSAGEIKRFEFRREIGIYAPPGGPDNRKSLVVETGEATFRPIMKMAPITVPRALISIEDQHLEVSAPEGTMHLPSGKPIALKSGRLASDNLRAEPSDAVVSIKARSDVAAAIELLQSEPMTIIDRKDLPLKSVEGNVEADLSLAFPMTKDVPSHLIKVSGSAKLSDGRIKKLAGEYDVQGASVAFEFNNSSVEAKGEALVRGVLAHIAWQHTIGATEDRQPPLRITATLDNTDRRQLGLELGHMLRGEVPIDLQVVRGATPGEHKVHVRAELTGAELEVPALSWRKPSGRNAFAEFDIAPGPQGKQELQNFRISGDNIAVEGWAAFGPDRKLREFYFPDFSLNVVTRLKVQGTLGNNNVWNIKARGTTLDGTDYFRSLFDIGRTPEENSDASKSDSGVDLDAQIDNIIGFSELSIKGVKIQLKNRGGKVAELEARGTLDGGAPLAVILDHDSSGQRRIRADSTDAGRAFKLIGFYPNMQDGRVRLELNVDGRGAAERTGTLWVEDFRVLGDPIVSEVVSSGLDDGRGTVNGKKRVIREVFEFDTMRVPFSVGHGQFAIEDAYMRGPLLGATLRGKVDFKSSRVNLGGTYIPLQGLNNAFGQIPLLGQILSGPRGEGIFGITFSVQGAMANPQVLANPLSLVAPGIFREVFQLNNPSTKLQAPKAEAPSQKVKRKRGTGTPSASDGAIDGWTSDTKP